MHFHRLGDVVQHEWLHRFFAVVQEGSLMFYDLGCDLKQRIVPAQQAFQEPPGLLQVVAQILII